MKNILILILLSINFYANAQKVINPVVTVSDLDNSLAFYTKILPFELVGIREIDHVSVAKLFNISSPETKAKIATLKLGEESFELMDFIEKENGLKIPEDSRSNDLWFQHIAIVVSDMDVAYKILSNKEVEQVSTMPETLPAYITAAAGIKAFYFHDPDGHNLEFIYFPQGKGNPKWQRPPSPQKGSDSKNIFLGIDHTAIGSDKTSSSLKFYRDILGLKIAGQSENYGSEQEHLNQVFGAHLKITGLASQQGIGVELLDYISPLGGRPYPKNTHANDLIHWHTIIEVENLNAIYEKLILQGYTVLSQGIVPLNDKAFKAKNGLLVRDSDGHAVLLCE
jgi:catechol 2,3-dioxygenase-like lactoylglutathione lyase family enzyme